MITILPKLPSADNEYTPEQRSVIDAQLAEGLADILHKEAKKLSAKKTKRSMR